jgi:hypothetical protein
MSFLNLDENMIFQYFSFAILFLVIVQFAYHFAMSPLSYHSIPAKGDGTLEMIGIIMFSFTFVDTVPSWFNEKSKSVDGSACVWYSLSLSVLIYLFLGIFGAWAFPHIATGNMLELMVDARESIWLQICVYLFSFTTIGIGIPVYTIITRYNLFVSNICSSFNSKLVAIVFPWCISFALYQGDGFVRFVNWSSLVFSNVINFILPAMVYIESVRRYGEGNGNGAYTGNGRESQTDKGMDVSVLYFSNSAPQVSTGLLQQSLDKTIDKPARKSNLNKHINQAASSTSSSHSSSSSLSSLSISSTVPSTSMHIAQSDEQVLDIVVNDDQDFQRMQGGALHQGRDLYEKAGHINVQIAVQAGDVDDVDDDDDDDEHHDDDLQIGIGRQADALSVTKDGTATDLDNISNVLRATTYNTSTSTITSEGDKSANGIRSEVNTNGTSDDSAGGPLNKFFDGRQHTRQRHQGQEPGNAVHIRDQSRSQDDESEQALIGHSLAVLSASSIEHSAKRARVYNHLVDHDNVDDEDNGYDVGHGDDSAAFAVVAVPDWFCLHHLTAAYTVVYSLFFATIFTILANVYMLIMFGKDVFA